MFEIRNGELYYKGVDKPLTYNKGRLRSVDEIEKLLGKKRLCHLGFDISMNKITAQQAVRLNKMKEELPCASDVAKADNIELQEVKKIATKSTEGLITQFKRQETLPMHDRLGFGKQLRSIRGLLKVEVAKKVQLEESIEKEKCKLEEFRDYPRVYNDGVRKDMKWIAKLNELKVRQESIDLLNPIPGGMANLPTHRQI